MELLVQSSAEALVQHHSYIEQHSNSTVTQLWQYWFLLRQLSLVCDTMQSSMNHIPESISSHGHSCEDLNLPDVYSHQQIRLSLKAENVEVLCIHRYEG
jgi:hypothetical protein